MDWNTDKHNAKNVSFVTLENTKRTTQMQKFFTYASTKKGK